MATKKAKKKVKRAAEKKAVGKKKAAPATKKKPARKKATRKKTAKKKARKKSKGRGLTYAQTPKALREHMMRNFVPKPYMRMRLGERVRYVGRARFQNYGPGSEGTVMEDESGGFQIIVQFDGAREPDLTERKHLRRVLPDGRLI